MNSIHIAVIDDGINEKLYNSAPLTHNIEITPELQIRKRNDYDPFEPSHGTTCAAIIQKYATGIILSSVKILNDKTKRGLKEQLIKAIRWCLENDVQLVNLSLGTIDYRDFTEVRNAVNSACQKSLIIVAACNNKDIFTYPASLSSVIGVKCDLSGKLKAGKYIYNAFAYDGIEVTACAKHSLKKYTGEVKTTFPCNSFAAPLVTSLVSNIMKASPGITLEEIKGELHKGDAKNTSPYHLERLYRSIDWVESAVLFNLSMDFAMLRDLPYAFKVKNCFDIKCSNLNEGFQRVNRFINENSDSLNNVDTIIIAVNNRKLGSPTTELSAFFDKIGCYKKNIIYLEDNLNDGVLQTAIQEQSIKIWHPCSYKLYFNGRKYKKNINVPVILICDLTGKELIKIESALRDLFRKDGYNALASSDTALGVAAGFEFSPVIAHSKKKNKVDIPVLKAINKVYDPDIILLGVDISTRNQNFISKIEASIENDIKLLIVDEHSAYPSFTSNDISHSKTLVVFSTNISESKKPGTIFLNYFYGNNLPELYEYIIYLFESDAK